MVRIAVLPVEVPEPEMNAGKVGPRRCYREIFNQSFVIFFAANINLAEQLVHMIRIRSYCNQADNLRHGDVTSRHNQVVTREPVIGMS